MIDDNQRELEERIRKNAVDMLQQLGGSFDNAQGALRELTKLTARKYGQVAQEVEANGNAQEGNQRNPLHNQMSNLMRFEEDLGYMKTEFGKLCVIYAASVEYKG